MSSVEKLILLTVMWVAIAVVSYYGLKRGIGIIPAIGMIGGFVITYNALT